MTTDSHRVFTAHERREAVAGLLALLGVWGGIALSNVTVLGPLAAVGWAAFWAGSAWFAWDLARSAWRWARTHRPRELVTSTFGYGLLGGVMAWLWLGSGWRWWWQTLASLAVYVGWAIGGVVRGFWAAARANQREVRS